MQTEHKNSMQPPLFAIPESAQKSLDVKALMLPDCPADRRQVPNEIVRSALFCAKNRRTPRPFLKKEKIAIIGGGEITFTGEELRQDDEAAWMHLIHLASKVPLGDPVCFTPYEFLRGLQKTAAKANYDWLYTVLTRMQATAVQFYSDRLGEGISTSLVTRFIWKSEETAGFGGKWVVWLEPTMRQLFDQTTHLRWEQRLSVPEGIASKLMGYWASHAKPYPVTVETLYAICRIEMKVTDFKKKLIKALDALKNIGFLADYLVVNNKVTVERA